MDGHHQSGLALFQELRITVQICMCANLDSNFVNGVRPYGRFAGDYLGNQHVTYCKRLQGALQMTARLV